MRKQLIPATSIEMTTDVAVRAVVTSPRSNAVSHYHLPSPTHPKLSLPPPADDFIDNPVIQAFLTAALKLPVLRRMRPNSSRMITGFAALEKDGKVAETGGNLSDVGEIPEKKVVEQEKTSEKNTMEEGAPAPRANLVDERMVDEEPRHVVRHPSESPMTSEPKPFCCQVATAQSPAASPCSSPTDSMRSLPPPADDFIDDPVVQAFLTVALELSLLRRMRASSNWTIAGVVALVKGQRDRQEPLSRRGDS